MLKAILADDEDIVRESMEKWIPWKELGIMLAGSASDGEEAYEMIIRERPDIVITDIRMPKIDGLELIRRVHCRLKDTGFIILSGFGEFSYAQKAMRYGVRHYMLKPARKEDLRDNLLELRNEIESRRRERMNVVAESGEKYSFYLQRGMMIEVLSDPSAIDGIIERSMSLTPFDPSEILTAFSSQVLDVQHFISVMIAAVRKRGIRMPIFPASAGGRVFFILDADPEESRGIAEDMRRAGGVYLGAATYGQLTNFNLDCVTVGIHKLGDSVFNRNWQIAQGSIIANVGKSLDEIHPIIVEGQGHTSFTNVEAFSGGNGAVTALGKSQDFMLVRGDKKLTISLYGARMRNYESPEPITIENPQAIIQATDCIDKNEEPWER